MVNAGNANVFTGRAGRRGGRGRGRARSPQALGCPRRGGVHRLDRRDRRACCRDERLAAGVPALHAGLREDGWEAPPRGDHDHRHLPQGRHARRRDRRREVRITGIAKGSGMIAPDMATMLCFVFTDAAIAGRRAADAAGQGRRPLASTASRSTATPRPPTRCCCSPPARPRHAPSSSRTIRALADFRRGAGRGAAGSRAAGGARRRGGAEAGRVTVERRRDRRSRPAHRAGGREFAAGQDRDRRRGRQLGPHRHGGRQGRRAGGPRQARASRSAAMWMARDGGAVPELRRGAGGQPT